MTITTQELLSFLNKANRLGIKYTIEQVDEIGYDIKMFYNWNFPEDIELRYVFIPNEGHSIFDGSLTYYSFEHINELLDARLEEKQVKEEKERKRKALLERLTAEERELLGL